MSIPQVFLAAGWSGGALPLSASEVHHLRDVRRVRSAEQLVVVMPDGERVLARITSVGPKGISAEPETRLGELWAPRVILVQGIAKGARMDIAIEKATELGVHAIIPLLSARTVVKLDAAGAERKRERWQRLAASAAKQSMQSSVPVVEPVARPADLGARLAEADHVFVFDASEDALSVREAFRRCGVTPDDEVAVVVGAEGGLEDFEIAALCEAGAVKVGLGPTVLRTETAGAVAVALVAYEMGGLGNSRA
ncbi:MAG: 16S rRNA (uracil(1498)-N(3))-methyltransferase [Coriobacteriia bacterium]